MKNRFYDKSQWDIEVALERQKEAALFRYYGSNATAEEIHQFTINPILESIRRHAKPCPFCGNTQLSFRYDIHYGHGDSSFDKGRIECDKCKASRGNVSNYGTPTPYDEMKAYEQWNNRNINIINTKDDE